MNKVVNQRKRLKDLLSIMLRWAEENKHTIGRKLFEVPEEWKKALKYVTALDLKLDTYNQVELTKEEMSKCNEYYSKYRWSEIII